MRKVCSEIRVLNMPCYFRVSYMCQNGDEFLSLFLFVFAHNRLSLPICSVRYDL
jgi:hypothetical protein